MPRYIRNRLPYLVAALWLWLFWIDRLGAPRLAEWEILGWFIIMMMSMVVVDRLYCLLMQRLVGVDPAMLHWSRRRVCDGRFFCPGCGSTMLALPQPLTDAGTVSCQDCGDPIATYGEMKPALHAYAWWALRPRWRRSWRFWEPG